MSRLDNFEEILKSYEAREDALGDLRALLDSASMNAYDSLVSELQQKVAKYVSYARKTGKIIVNDKDGTFHEDDISNLPSVLGIIISNLIDRNLMDRKNGSKPVDLWMLFDKLLGEYEKNEQTR